MSKKLILPIIIVLSFIIRVEHEINLFDFALDKSWQLESMSNFLNGNGIAICETDPTDFAEATCNQQINWPFGYYYYMLPFYFITNDLIPASILFDISALLILYFSLFKILRFLELKDTGIALQIGTYAFASFPLYFISSTDLMAIALFLLLICLVLYFYLRNELNSWKCLLSITVVTFFVSSIRFAYQPMVLVIPLSVLVLSVLRQNLNLGISGVKILLSFIGTLMLVSFIQKVSTGKLNYLSSRQEGWYIESLLHFDPFIFKGFFFTTSLINRFNLEGAGILYFINITMHLVSAFIIIVLVRFTISEWKEKVKNESFQLFSVITALTLLINVSMLSYLSVRFAPQLEWTAYWTYVEETRYFTPSVVLIQIAVFYIIFSALNKGNNNLGYILRGFVWASFFYAFVYWGFKKIEINVIGNTNRLYNFDPLIIQFAGERISELQTQDLQVVYADRNGYNRSYLKTKYDVNLIYDFDKLMITNKPKNNENYRLLVTLPKHTESIESAFLGSHKVKSLGESGTLQLIEVIF